MGLAIDRQDFTADDYRQFSERLNQNLAALEQLLQRPGFGEFPANQSRKIGCELELYLIDKSGRPSFINQEIQKELNDPQLTLELNRYNLEYNLDPVALSDKPFQTTGRDIKQAIKRINHCAKKFDSSAVAIGIMPTLTQDDFGYQAMTDLPRYHALTRQLRAIRGGPFSIDIIGKDRLQLQMEDVTLEGANTSFQIHYQVSPSDYPDTYNALQMVTPLVVAIAANSPTLFSHRLWHETRIPLFKQSIDCRRYDPLHPQPARVNYGHSWLRESALELFTEAVRLYRPLLPLCGDEDPIACLKNGGTPQLHELRLQQGSVWLWNRPVYDPIAGGHLRIEMRALPAGPSIKDMLANAALLLGLTEVMRPRIRTLLSIMPFEYCLRNFYRAAELGLNAEMIWPDHQQHEPRYHTCEAILTELLDEVPEGLEKLGVPKKDYQPLLKIIQARLDNGQTGAQWQLNTFEHLQQQMDQTAALQQLLLHYQHNSQGDIPVSEWQIP